ncbi:hypothetical protein AB205_0112070 [Aquarana catesbeiana]|uniref:Uncharacterized protein n=1 Tax=Aquarana catesbeiana TaxID=8400 RepID=A0A2G9SFT8_AQUCT|nr:hypothetical protein AB205_0112070 [Aquarana catesbeiana]
MPLTLAWTSWATPRIGGLPISPSMSSPEIATLRNMTRATPALDLEQKSKCFVKSLLQSAALSLYPRIQRLFVMLVLYSSWYETQTPEQS